METLEVEGGSYMLSWTGTAQGRVNAGSYAASPVAVTSLTANTAITVEFNTGTVGQAQLEPGAVATAFERRPMQQELALCQRFYQVYQGFVATAYVTGNGLNSLPYAVPLRASPSVTYSNVVYTNSSAIATYATTSTVGVVQITSSGGFGFASATISVSADL
jgi:hypothetical protein